MDANAEQQEPCYLLKLPPELRLEIYGYLYSVSLIFRAAFLGRVIVNPSYQRRWSPAAPDSNLLAPLRTCKTIQHEATPVFYDSVTLKLSMDNSWWFWNEVPRSVDEWHALRQTKRVEIDVTVSPFGRRVEYVTKLLKALDYGRHLEYLVLRFYMVGDLNRLRTLCDTLRTIECEGKVVVCKGDDYNHPSSPVEKEILAELAQAIGGEVGPPR